TVRRGHGRQISVLIDEMRQVFGSAFLPHGGYLWCRAGGELCLEGHMSSRACSAPERRPFDAGVVFARLHPHDSARSRYGALRIVPFLHPKPPESAMKMQ